MEVSIMSYKKYNYKDFSCKLPNGKDVIFRCWAENTRYGFRHLCLNFDDLGYKKYTSKRCYYNRTWERFEYESVLEDAIETLPNDIRGVVYATLIDGTAEKIKAECDKFLSAFKTEYDKLPSTTKDVLKNVSVNNQNQADTLLKTMKMINIINGK